MESNRSKPTELAVGDKVTFLEGSWKGKTGIVFDTFLSDRSKLHVQVGPDTLALDAWEFNWNGDRWLATIKHSSKRYNTEYVAPTSPKE